MEFESIINERNEFPGLNDKCYLLTPETGMMPSYVYKGVQEYIDQRYHDGGNSVWGGMSTIEMMSNAKEKLGEMIGCDEDNISLADNSSRMLNLFADNIPLERGDNIVIPADSFISDKYAWQYQQRYGIEVRYVKSNNGIVSPEMIFDQVDSKTKVISICLVESSTGFMHNAEAIGSFCEQHGIWFCVDAVQGMGVMPIDVRKMKIDYLVGNDYKWMMGFGGTGFAYISPYVQKVLGGQGAGWMSDSDRFNTSKTHLQIRDDAGKYEMGLPNSSGIFAMSQVAGKYNILGREKIYAYVTSLCDYLIGKISETDGLRMKYDYPKANRSSINVVEISGKGRISNETLRKDNIFISGEFDEEKENYNARVGIHYYNNYSDIDYFVDTLKTQLQSI